MEKILIISIILAIIIIAIAVFFIEHFLFIHKSIKSISILDKENSLNIFSSNTLSFNFTKDFYLVNTSNLLISSYKNSARLYYEYNKSIYITVVQNLSNKNISYYRSIFINGLNVSHYSLNNISIDGYNGIEASSDKLPIGKIVAIIAGPAGYYTTVAVQNLNQSLINVSNAAFNLILSTMKFAPSKYLNTS